jgi:molybdopterin converting factor small subunit
MKTITIKFTGALASLAEVKSVSLVVDDQATYSTIIQKLGELFPALIGVIIDQDGKTMLSSNMFLANGQDFVMNGMWDQSPNDRDHLTLISPTTGG